jgi:MFS family permease
VTYRQLLEANANLRRVWIAQVISEVGDWLNNIAVLALILELADRSNQGIAIALYVTARHLPQFLLGPVAGVLADRISRTSIMIFSDLIRAVLALGFMLAEALSSLPLVYFVGASLICLSTFFNVARRAATPSFVTTDLELHSANALMASTSSATLAIGSAIGGLLAAGFGRNTVFVINSISFLISADLVRKVVTFRDDTRERESAERQGLGFYRDFVEGLAYVRDKEILRTVFIVVAVWGLGNGCARAIYSIAGAELGSQLDRFTANPSEFGISLLFIAIGVGGLIGAPLSRRYRTTSAGFLERRMGRSMIIDGFSLLSFSFIFNVWIASAILAFRELNFALWWTAQQTILMNSSEERFRGRVFASYETLTTFCLILSMLVAGKACDLYGYNFVACAGGLVIIVSGLLWFLLRLMERKRSQIKEE